MLINAVVLLLLPLLHFHTASGESDARRTAVEIIRSRGFKAEEHFVTTADGYILTLHRIVDPRSSGRKKPILLQHGFIASSTFFLINSPGGHINENISVVGNNLGFELSKRGYDVWLSNSRGNRYSLNHTLLTTSDEKFWEFTFSEMAQYDLPAVIDYVLKFTNYSSLGYIGHSQGTMIMFALLSEKPYFAKYIKPFIALAPITSLKHSKSPIVHLARTQIFDAILRSKGPFIISESLTYLLRMFVCNLFKFNFLNLKFDSQSICQNVVYAIVGFNHKETNLTRLNVYLSHMPAGTSSWNALHFVQLMRSDNFQKFDHGDVHNLAKYGQLTPPIYDLSRIKSPNIALIYSENDLLSDLKDTQTLKQKLRMPLLDDYLVPDPLWNHIDFCFGINAGKYINTRVLRILSKF